MTAPPGKIKIFLAAVKENLLDKTEESATPEQCYLTLLKLEVVQRGVIVADDDKNPSKILEVVRSIAGKSLLEDGSSFPKQLLAGSAVMAGRVAEQLSKTITSSESTLMSLNKLFDSGEIKSVITRCTEVEEERLKVLLDLIVNAKDQSVDIFKCRLLYIAEGYYYRASGFQPDAPPIWKRAWDAVVERQRIIVSDTKTRGEMESSSSWEAGFALENLHRIAASKGNNKRAAELTLRLAESYLDSLSYVNAADEGTQAVIQAFVSPYRSIKPPSESQAVEKAYQFLKDSSLAADVLSEDDSFLRLILELRVYFSQEEIAIEQATNDAYSAAKNRVQEGGGKKQQIIVSLVELRSKTRRHHLANVQDDDTPLDTSAAVLRDNLLAIMESDQSHVPTELLDSARRLMKQYVLRQQERAKAIALSGANKDTQERAWAVCARFIGPLLDGMEKQVRRGPFSDDGGSPSLTAMLHSLSIDELAMMETVSIIVPCIEWMHSGLERSEGLITEAHLRLARDLLFALHKDAKEASDKQHSAGLVRTSSDPDAVHALKIECAFRSSQALLYLMKTDVESDNLIIRQITNTAVSNLDDVATYGQSVSEFGLSFLEYLVCWSGLHRKPWPFCILAEARNMVVKAKLCLEQAASEWGRCSPAIENWIVDLGQADAERLSFAGGLAREAEQLYNGVLKSVESSAGDKATDRTLMRIVACRCFLGLAELTLHATDYSLMQKEGAQTPEELAIRSLEEAQSISKDEELHSLYIWRSDKATWSSIRFQLAASRQTVADTLLRKGLVIEAQRFLEDAVQDAPSDSSAAFALGAFHLRMMFFGDNRSSELEKAAQVRLLKAAKMDSSKASPFALLGYWYEYFKDMKRAVGCYSKALLLDPSHSVAGRGLLRLKSSDALINVLENATADESSSLNGWAWRALGQQKTMEEGKDDLAVVSLLKSLRCRDIQNPISDPLSVFYSDPLQPKFPGRDEEVAVSLQLAACYHRLGRYTAAIRAYHSAIEAAGDSVTSLALSACAQVEMELGLFDEAAEKFSKAMCIEDDQINSMAGYGLSLTLLSIAQRDSQDGKAGAAFAHLQQAINICKTLDSRSGCVQKLIGDLHSFGASLPPEVFVSEDSEVSVMSRDENMLRSQLAFISSGADAYRIAEGAVIGSDADETNVLRACISSDLGSNLLLQAQLLSFWHENESSSPKDSEEEVYSRAAEEFRRALQLSPLYAPAWCGLGCAVVRTDPLLAQHCFCRSLELDNLFPDAYANLSFLYTSNNVFSPSASVSDALTQVADSPMNWMNRALILERQASRDLLETADDDIRQAADAYRSALQVVRHPSAMLGLAMTCRIGGTQSSSAQTRQESSSCFLSEYLSATGGCADIPAFVFNGVLTMERGVSSNATFTSSQSSSQRLVQEGRNDISEGLGKLNGVERQDGFDSELIRSTLLEGDAVSDGNGKGNNDQAPTTTTTLPEFSLARQIVHEPNRGDLWLALAKELTMQELANNNDHPSKQALEAARTAACKASSILLQQLTTTKPVSCGGATIVVQARDLSDALSLQHWLERIIIMEDQDDEDDPTKLKDGETCSSTSLVDVQRSLILCPDNAMAREIIVCESNRI